MEAYFTPKIVNFMPNYLRCIFAINYDSTIFCRSFSRLIIINAVKKIKGKENVKIDYIRNKSNKNIKTPGAGAASLVSKLCHSMSKKD